MLTAAVFSAVSSSSEELVNRSFVLIKTNEPTKLRIIIKNRVDLKRKNLPNGDFHHETTSMEEVVAAEGDTLVMAAHRNNGPEPAARMAAVTEQKKKHPVIYSRDCKKTKFQKKSSYRRWIWYRS